MAGLASAGVDVLLLGVLPTPGVAYLTGTLGADLGVMLSASHNPMPDNGIKFLARGGHKLDDAIEIAIERRLHQEWERPTGGDVGRVDAVPHRRRGVRRPPGAHHRPPAGRASGSSSTARRAPPATPARRRSTDAGADVTAIHA